jgi:hypothetical protein
MIKNRRGNAGKVYPLRQTVYEKIKKQCKIKKK